MVKFIDKMSSDVAFLILGIVLGATWGTALVIVSSGDVARFGNGIIAAAGALTSASIAAIMIRHQLKANYENQKKLEQFRMLSDVDTRKALDEVADELRNTAQKLKENNTIAAVDHIKIVMKNVSQVAKIKPETVRRISMIYGLIGLRRATLLAEKVGEEIGLRSHRGITQPTPTRDRFLKEADELEGMAREINRWLRFDGF